MPTTARPKAGLTDATGGRKKPVVICGQPMAVAFDIDADKDAALDCNAMAAHKLEAMAKSGRAR